ncbi:MAG: hypothetical protein ETSY2_44640 [Candidatus Entotheonella gemina]|uniref:Uncharacterized protein n=1 Tax=Candidatus Entotheonella gemina TaxID=1429439 RepID=W4LHI0_9BACT|nr:MAG: hypothetical protein ETSY2_44640 [Candidatus Entotheonella gemina]
MEPVPDFFQGEDGSARVEQLEWLRKHLSLTDDFFARVLSTDASLITEWRFGCKPLDQTLQKKVERLWRMFLHLFSMLNFDYARTRELLEAEAAPIPSLSTPNFFLPWAGGSIRGYLESHGEKGVEEVNRWVISFRFANRYPVSSLPGQ